MPRYELDDGSSSKFWQIELEGTSFTTRYGRIGTDGQTSTKTFSDPETAGREYDKITKSKVRKGYQLVDDGGASAAGPSVSTNAQLESAIFENPSDVEAWQVYGDWLQTEGDPRGELVNLEVAKEASAGDVHKQAELTDQLERLIEQHQAEWLGPEVMRAIAYEDDDLVDIEWRYGFIWRVKVKATYGFQGPSVEQLLKAILKSSASRFVHEIRVGLPDSEEPGFQREILALAKNGLRPSVRRIYIGDFEFPDETEISWTEVGNVEKLYPVFPNLNWLKVQGGGILLGKLQHPTLETLILHTGGLPSEATRSISRAQLPQLKTLEIWFGEEDYGGDTTVDELEPLTDADGVPRLRHLGLQNATFSDEIPDLLAGSKLLDQLETLDLSMGTMSEYGANRLIERAENFRHLKRLNVDDNVLSFETVEQLRDVFEDVLVSNYQKDEEDYRYVSVGE